MSKSAEAALAELFAAAKAGGTRARTVPAANPIPTVSSKVTTVHVPIIGPIYAELLSGHSILVYLAFLMVPFTWWVLYRTRFGLRLRAVGENPAAVDTAGISVRGLRYGAVVICGVLVGLAGVYLVLSQEAYFQPHMSAGRGFIALAALVFAKWRPWPALAT